MTTMDVKGITWVGCVYEKFESMCLEVEENMYQDTVNFVEDQVQTVGESVKKFYADVMQDFLCHSSLDQDDISPCGFPVEHYSDGSKKSKLKKEHAKVGVEEVNGDSEVISSVEKNVNCSGLFHRQRVYDSCTKSSGNCAKVELPDLYSRQEYSMRSYSKKVVVKETPIKDRLQGANTAVGKDFSRVSLSCSEFSNENIDTLCDQPDEGITPSKPVEGMRCNSMRESCVAANASQCTNDIVINSQSPDMIILDKFDGKRWNELPESSIGGLSAEVNGGSNISLVDESNSVEHGTVIIQQSDKAKLEETCVLKKIPKAFTSRTSSVRQQEYKQLALWHGHHTNSFLEGEEESNKSQTHDFCESEWEIL
ncbi:uncharacterized protein LOC126800286 isoform X2 [Argentina anserina]|uniref:uncharacterized protein LOC126800286 isoform X2 n=1 Tax=Argentina anserina TaxID=57926 RepID=UPI002176724C|nr:uncharacterized protein LOC126800286 isoform X2 [Potentilla anserina]